MTTTRRYRLFGAFFTIALLATVYYVGVMKKKVFAEQFISTIPGKPNCSLQNINRYILSNSVFPGGGHWDNLTDQYVHYTSEYCNLLPPFLVTKHASLFMSIAKPRKIMLTGDSQGKRYTDAFLWHLGNIGYWCKTLKSEGVNEGGYQPDKAYFLQGTGIKAHTVVMPRRTCHSCLSFYSRCQNPTTKHQVDVEYISMTMFVNADMISNNEYCQNSLHKKELVCSVANQQEFLFKLYLKNRFPDYILMFTSFSHCVNNLEKTMMDFLPKLYQLIANNDPHGNSTVVWVPTSSADLTRFRDKWIDKDKRDAKYENGNDYNQQINRLNHALFKSLRNELRLRQDSGRTKMFGFLDLYAMTQGQELKNAWFTDHVHSKPILYRIVTAYLLQSLYESVADNNNNNNVTQEQNLRKNNPL